MRLETQAIVVAVRAHGEHGAIVRALTVEAGLLAGYVRGGRSRRLKPVLVPGNLIHADFRARTDEQLAHLSADLVHSRAFLLSEALPAAAIEWACALAAASLPEGQAYPALYEGLDGLLAAIEAAPSARGWAAALVRFELLMLAELGFGLERSEVDRLAPGGAPSAAAWADIQKGLRATGERLGRDLLTGRSAAILAARERLVERLKRVGG